MESVHAAVERTEAPRDVPHAVLDARDLPPPKPLQETLERLEVVDHGTVFVQLNDRVPQFLYPTLEERGYSYETLDGDDGTVTVIWRS